MYHEGSGAPEDTRVGDAPLTAGSAAGPKTAGNFSLLAPFWQPGH